MGAGERHRTRVITADGELHEGALSDDHQVALWARALHRKGDGLVEVVAARRRPDGTLSMRSRSAAQGFPPAGDVQALVGLTRRHREAGEEAFCTPLTRRARRSGKAGGTLPARCCWVDIDEPAHLARLRAFAHRPHLVVYSGSGGAHAYWRLADPLAVEDLEAANRKLAVHLGADAASTDRARIMRLPGTHNHKADRPCRLVFCDLARPPIDAGRLLAGLEDPDPAPPPPTPAQLRRRRALLEGDQGAQLTPPAYFHALAGVEVPDRGGHVPCPLPDHREQLASCMVYADADAGWCCYGCSRGGAIYDLASLLDGGSWGRALRGEEFRAVKRRVHDALGLDPPPTARRDGRPQRPRRREASSVGGRR